MDMAHVMSRSKEVGLINIRLPVSSEGARVYMYQQGQRGPLYSVSVFWAPN